MEPIGQHFLSGQKIISQVGFNLVLIHERRGQSKRILIMHSLYCNFGLFPHSSQSVKTTLGVEVFFDGFIVRFVSSFLTTGGAVAAALPKDFNDKTGEHEVSQNLVCCEHWPVSLIEATVCLFQCFLRYRFVNIACLLIRISFEYLDLVESVSSEKQM
jgi:hypothetical protein